MKIIPFLAWGDFHARSRFARFPIPEGKWGTSRSLSASYRRKEGVGIVLNYARESSIESSFIITKPTTAYIQLTYVLQMTVIISGPDLDADQDDQHWIKSRAIIGPIMALDKV